MKSLRVLILLLIASTASPQSVTLTNCISTEIAKTNFSLGVTGVAASLTQIVPAPNAGQSIYISNIIATSDTTTAGLMTFRYGTGTNCGTGTVTLLPGVASVTSGKLGYPGNASVYGVKNIHFTTPIRVPAGNALCVICVATNTCTVTVIGFVN